MMNMPSHTFKAACSGWRKLRCKLQRSFWTGLLFQTVLLLLEGNKIWDNYEESNLKICIIEKRFGGPEASWIECFSQFMNK